MSFSTNIPYGNKSLVARFIKVACPSGKYFIEVASGDNIVASFEMQKDHHSKWRVTNPVPQWIIDLEPEFAQAITKNQFVASADIF
jgi:hypothetical protein